MVKITILAIITIKMKIIITTAIKMLLIMITSINTDMGFKRNTQIKRKIKTTIMNNIFKIKFKNINIKAPKITIQKIMLWVKGKGNTVQIISIK